MKRKRRVLVVAQDAGGFQAVIPVYRRLRRKRSFVVQGLFGDVVRGFPTAKGLRFVKPSKVTHARLERLVRDFRPQVVLAGPGAGLSLDKRIISIARRSSIPVVTVLDYCGNFKMFFSDPGTRNNAYLPDALCVVAEACCGELKREGYPAGIVHVTGSPAFEARFRPTLRKRYVLFVCQPFSELKRKFSGIGFGYDERDVFQDAVEALEAAGCTMPLVVKWHPWAKNRHKFDDIIRTSRLRIRTDSETPVSRLIKKAAIIIGMNSTALFEAALKGAPVVSYQPGLSKRDPLLTNRWGLSLLVKRKQDLSRVVRRMLAGRPGRRPGKRPPVMPRHPTQNVIRVLSSFL